MPAWLPALTMRLEPSTKTTEASWCARGIRAPGVGHDDDQVADTHLVGGGAVELDRAAAALAGDRVGREALAVVDVDDVDLWPGTMFAASSRSSSTVIEPT